MYFKIRLNPLLQDINNLLRILKVFSNFWMVNKPQSWWKIDYDTNWMWFKEYVSKWHIPTALHFLRWNLKQTYIYWKRGQCKFSHLWFTTDIGSCSLQATRLIPLAARQTREAEPLGVKCLWEHYSVPAWIEQQDQVVVLWSSCHPRSWRTQQMTNLKRIDCLKLFFKVFWCVLTQSFP